MISKEDENALSIRMNFGAGTQRVPVYKFDINKNFSVWKLWRTKSSGGEGIQSNAGQQGAVKTQVYLRGSDLTGFESDLSARMGFYNIIKITAVFLLELREQGA